MRKGEEVGQNISKTSVQIYMRLIADQKCCIVTGRCHFHWDNMSSGGSEIERLGSFCMQMFIHRNKLLAAINDWIHFYIQLLSVQWLLVCHYGARQQSVNNFLSCIFGTQTATWAHPSKVIVWPIVIGRNESDTLVALSWKWVSTIHQWLLVLWVWSSRHDFIAVTHNQSIGRL